LSGDCHLAGEFGETEIHDLDLVTVGDEDIGRFDVAVNGSTFVSRFERLADLDGDADRLIDRHRAAHDPLLEGIARAVGHGDEKLPLRCFTDIKDGADVGVVEGRGGASLAGEALTEQRFLAPLHGQEFEGDRAVEASVLGAA